MVAKKKISKEEDGLRGLQRIAQQAANVVNGFWRSKNNDEIYNYVIGLSNSIHAFAPELIVDVPEFRIGAFCNVKHEVWEEFYFRGGTQEEEWPQAQPIIGLHPDGKHVMLAYPTWWWTKEELELVDDWKPAP